MQLLRSTWRCVPCKVGAAAIVVLTIVTGALWTWRWQAPPGAVVEAPRPAGDVREGAQTDASLDRLWQADSRLRGDPNAPVTLIEYSDFTCGYCAKFFRETWPRLASKYVATGKVRFLYRDYPRDPNGPGMMAALAARCAGEQGNYWDMHDRLFSGPVTFDRIKAYAQAIGLNLAAFTTCLRDAPYRAAILQDKADGLRIGFVGTPGFVLLRTMRAGHDKLIGLPGAFPAEVFEREIERLLLSVGSANKG